MSLLFLAVLLQLCSESKKPDKCYRLLVLLKYLPTVVILTTRRHSGSPNPLSHARLLNTVKVLPLKSAFFVEHAVVAAALKPSSSVCAGVLVVLLYLSHTHTAHLFSFLSSSSLPPPVRRRPEIDPLGCSCTTVLVLLVEEGAWGTVLPDFSE